LSKRSLRALPLGDSALTIVFDTARSRELLHKLHAAAAAVAEASLPEVYDVVPGYLSIAVYYDALRMSYDEIAPKMVALCEAVTGSQTITLTKREHQVPVVYDGPDLADVAKATGLTIEGVISRHAGRTYTVDLIGFVPGFAYLGELDPALRLDRRAQPRPRVPAGSVAIAGAQTGVYPLDTPGGWHILGHTHLLMFDPTRDPPALLRPGDIVQFVPVQ
jgi:KipI family sensor histidine kinase inhibitor